MESQLAASGVLSRPRRSIHQRGCEDLIRIFFFLKLFILFFDFYVFRSMKMREKTPLNEV